MWILIVGVLSLVVGILLGHKLAYLDALAKLQADLNTGSVELGGWRYSVSAIEFPGRAGGGPCTSSHC